MKSDDATNSRAERGSAGMLGAVCTSPRTYAVQGPRVVYVEKPFTVFQPSPYGRPKSLICVCAKLYPLVSGIPEMYSVREYRDSTRNCPPRSPAVSSVSG